MAQTDRYVVAALFRVRLEYLTQKDPKDDPACDGTCHKTLNVVARDADGAITRALTYAKFFMKPGRVRLRSIEFIESIDVAPAAWVEPNAEQQAVKPKRS